MTTKTCNDCQIEKPHAEFNEHPLGKHGLQAYCKECQRARNREYARKRTGYYERRERIQLQTRPTASLNFFPSAAEFYHDSPSR